MLSVRRALLFSIVERYFFIAVAVGSSVVIARLLTPEQIGVYSVSLAFIGIAQSLRDFGIGTYLIQERELTAAKIQTAFSISALLGVVLCVAVNLSAPALAGFFGDARMQVTLRIASLNFLLMPFNTIYSALLKRGMQFKRLLYVAMASSLTTAAVSVGLALSGAGENSLAIGALLGSAVAAAAGWLASPERAPLRPSLAGWRAVVSFGGQSSLASVASSVATDSNDLIVGKLLDFHSVGILSRAQGLMSLFHRDLMGGIRNVAFPAIAAAHREGIALGRPFLRAVALVAVFAWPFYGLVAIYAPEIVLLMYGSQWTAAIAPVPLYCAAGAVMAVYVLVPNLIVAVGRIGLATGMDLLIQPLRIALIAAAAWHYRSVEACAAAFLLSAMVSLPVAWYCKRRCVPDDGPATFRAALATLAVTGAVLAPALAQASWAGWGRSVPLPLWQWVPACALGAALGLWTAFLVRHPLSEEAWLRQALRAGRLAGPQHPPGTP
jgi:O-antigen/teichoic acid export membrane protein